MIFYDGYNIDAEGLSPVPIEDYQECAQECIKTLNCRGFTWEPPYLCHLKVNVGYRNVQKSSKTGLVSGILCDGNNDESHGKFKVTTNMTARDFSIDCC